MTLAWELLKWFHASTLEPNFTKKWKKKKKKCKGEIETTLLGSIGENETRALR